MFHNEFQTIKVAAVNTCKHWGSSSGRRLVYITAGTFEYHPHNFDVTLEARCVKRRFCIFVLNFLQPAHIEA